MVSVVFYGAALAGNETVRKYAPAGETHKLTEGGIGDTLSREPNVIGSTDGTTDGGGLFQNKSNGPGNGNSLYITDTIGVALTNESSYSIQLTASGVRVE
jgi:hypothetical protein